MVSFSTHPLFCFKAPPTKQSRPGAMPAQWDLHLPRGTRTQSLHRGRSAQGGGSGSPIGWRKKLGEMLDIARRINNEKQEQQQQLQMQMQMQNSLKHWWHQLFGETSRSIKKIWPVEGVALQPHYWSMVSNSKIFYMIKIWRWHHWRKPFGRLPQQTSAGGFRTSQSCGNHGNWWLFERRGVSWRDSSIDMSWVKYPNPLVVFKKEKCGAKGSWWCGLCYADNKWLLIWVSIKRRKLIETSSWVNMIFISNIIQ